MDHLIIKNAIGGLDTILSQARRALWEIGRDIYVVGDEDDNQGSYADPRAALGGTLEELYDTLLSFSKPAKCPNSA